MKTFPSLMLVVVLCVVLSRPAAHAAVVSFQVSTSVSHVEGSYVCDVSIGHTITGAFVVDGSSANAGPDSDPNPSFEPGHEYSAFWEFPGAAYSVRLSNVPLDSGFANEAPPAVVVNNDLAITAAQTAGLVADGVYDWIEVLGSTTIDYCPADGGACRPASGEEWSLAIFSDTGWLSDGGELPNGLPGGFTAFLVGLEFDALGNEVGRIIAPADTLSVTAVPLPAPLLLLGSALAILGMIRRPQPAMAVDHSRTAERPPVN